MSRLIGFLPEEDYLCYLLLLWLFAAQKKEEKNAFMHGSRFGSYFYVQLNQDVDGPVLLDLFPN